MRRAALLLAVALAVASGGVHAAPPALSHVEGPALSSVVGPTPVIVELFTSEGCSDCPAADKLLEQLVATQPVPGAAIIALGQHVDYWDRLGWKDRFSSAAVTRRQQLYQTRFNTDSIYTPQMVVDGRSEFVGSDAAAARKAIEKTLAAPHGIVKIERQQISPGMLPGGDTVRFVHLVVTVSDLPAIARGDQADIVLMVTESGLTTDVKRGENHGKVLKHAPVVRFLTRLGHVDAGRTAASGAGDVPIERGWQTDKLSFVVFVQEQRSRMILAAASAALK